MPVFDRSVIPLGSTVLVTGVNGFVGSHVASQLLDYGYKVRGTVRDAQKHAWLSGIFEKRYGHGNFELFQAGNLIDEGVFDEAVKGKPSSSSAIVYALTGRVRRDCSCSRSRRCYHGS